MQMNLNILTENNHSSLLSKNVPTADNALLQYMQKVTQGTNNTDTEDKKQQKLQHIVNKLKHGKKLTAQEMEFPPTQAAVCKTRFMPKTLGMSFL